MKPLIVHGHFYQPPRENPWTGVVDEEPTAKPFHDWNERITAECYKPNSEVRIVEEGTGKQRVINNYENLSFDFGPTLLSWLERHHPETYARILAADAASVRTRSGHGNAIAQGYSHAILPLCNERDRKTQIRWGLADFRFRFEREPEALWLPETACNDEVLGSLIDEGLRYVILAPQQAKRIRNINQDDLIDENWKDASDGTIDTSIPYYYRHRDGSNRSIAIFFYDQQLAGAIAFEQALSSSKLLADRFAQRANGAGRLVNVATDGETYGHHHKFGDVCLAYALTSEGRQRDLWVTNYGEFLDRYPTSVEVEIKVGPEGKGTSWSCIHGTSRWASDCGCHTGGEAGWNQAWRRPLRQSLDFLRDQIAAHFEQTRGELFSDPWEARDDAIELVLRPGESREKFLHSHAPRELSRSDIQKALVHLELQRMTLLMYTSCGWFFNDISGIEPLQNLKYACRAIELMEELRLPTSREGFLAILAEAKSNKPEMGSGADIYNRLVERALSPSVRG